MAASISLKHLSSRWPLVLSYLFLAVLPACGDGPAAPPTLVATLTLSRDTATLVPGATASLSASPRDAQGKPLTRTITWTSSDVSVATVASGLVTAIGPGRVTISATAMTVTSRTEITVKEGAVVGPEGASFTVASGAVTVTVPAGAVAAPAQMTVDSVPIATAVPRLLAGTVFRLESAAPVNMPVRVGLRYNSAKLSAGSLEKGLKLYLLTGEKWVRAGESVVDTVTDRVFASISSPGTFAVFEQAPAVASINAGNNQTTTVATAVSVRPSIKVIDVEGFPVPDLAVSFTVSAGGGAITGGNAVTDVQGIATVGSWTLGTRSAENTLTATVASASGGPIIFSASAAAGAPSKLVFAISPPTTAQNNTPFPTQPAIQEVDEYGNPVSTSGIAITAGVTDGSASLGGTRTRTTNSSGVATFNDLLISGSSGQKTLTFTSGNLPPLSAIINVTAGPPAKLVFAPSPPANAQSTVPFTVQPGVQVADEFGNPVLMAGIGIGATITAGSATLGGTRTRTTNSSGIAIFNDLLLTGSSGQKGLTFTSGNLLPLSAFINVTGGSGAATQLLAGNNQVAIAGALVSVLPAVRITDVAGDPVAGLPVFFNVTEGGGQITGGESTTDANGIARVGSWTLGTVAGPNTLRAVASGLAESPVIFTATGVHGPPASMVLISGANQVGPAGRGPRNYILFRVFDGNGNGIPDVTINLSVTAGGGSIPASEKTLSTGVAVVRGWTFGKSAGVQRVQATLATNPAIAATVDATATTLRIVTFGDSNTDYGYVGYSSQINQVSYISANPQRPTPFVPNAFTQLAGKIESFWTAQYSPAIIATNHAILGTSSGSTRSTAGAPGARTVVNGVTRFGGEVLGIGYPWNGAEPTGSSFPGPIARLQAFTPTAEDFVYVSIGTNDGGQLITAAQTLENLTWMIEAWESRGLPTDHFILTNLPPAPGQTQLEAERNRAIRTLGLTRGVRFIDLTAYTSNDDGITWKSSSLHVGDEIHYSESVREWIAQQIISIMASATQPYL